MAPLFQSFLRYHGETGQERLAPTVRKNLRSQQVLDEKNYYRLGVNRQWWYQFWAGYKNLWKRRASSKNKLGRVGSFQKAFYKHSRVFQWRVTRSLWLRVLWIDVAVKIYFCSSAWSDTYTTGDNQYTTTIQVIYIPSEESIPISNEEIRIWHAKRARCKTDRSTPQQNKIHNIYHLSPDKRCVQVHTAAFTEEDAQKMKKIVEEKGHTIDANLI